MTARLSCVVLSLRSEPGLVAAVRSLLAQDGEIEVVVVNSGGGDPGARLAHAGLDVPVVDRRAPLYPGAVRNLGIDATTAPYVAFLAADSLAHPGWVAGRLQEHAAGASAVASCLTNAYPESATAWAGLILFHGRRMSVIPPEERLYYGLSYARTLFERFGRFREDLRAGEDTEFNGRLTSDVLVVWAPDVVTAHRYPTRPLALMRDAYRRGRLQAAMVRRITGGRGQRARIAVWGALTCAQAVRLALRSPSAERAALLRAVPVLVPASLAFSAGALAEGRRPYDDPTRSAWR